MLEGFQPLRLHDQLDKRRNERYPCDVRSMRLIQHYEASTFINLEFICLRGR